MSSLLRLERKQKISSNAFRIRLFPLCYYSFGIEMINTFIHSRSFLEKLYPIPHQNGKVYTRIQTKKAQNPYPLWRHKSTWLI